MRVMFPFPKLIATVIVFGFSQALPVGAQTREQAGEILDLIGFQIVLDGTKERIMDFLVQEIFPFGFPQSLQAGEGAVEHLFDPIEMRAQIVASVTHQFTEDELVLIFGFLPVILGAVSQSWRA